MPDQLLDARRREKFRRHLSWQRGQSARSGGAGKARCEGHYLLRTHLPFQDPAALWKLYVQLSEAEAAFRSLKDDLALRPIYHQLEQRIEALIFTALMSYGRHVSLRAHKAARLGTHPARGARSV
ncbi:transposase, partial [mine drainage metagenome]